MDRIKTNREPVLTWALPIRILSVVAILGALLSFFSAFLIDCVNFIRMLEDTVDLIDNFFLIFRFEEFVYAVLAVLSMILLAVYLFGLYRHKNSGMLITAVLGIFAVKYLSSVLGSAGVFGLLVFFACIPAIISAFLEFRNKVLLVVSMSVMLLAVSALGIWECTQWLDSWTQTLLLVPLFGFAAALMELGSACIFIVTLLLFGLKNNTQLIATVPVEEETDPEQELLDLREQYDAGQISEEEYQAQRTEIISKL